MDIKDYVRQLLKDTDCPENAYADISVEAAQQDLKDYYRNNGINPPADFSVPKIAEALIAVGKEAEAKMPKPQYQYKMIWDNGDCVDGQNCETFEEAVTAAKETYIGWQGAQFAQIGKANPADWSEKDKEDWNCMIENCCCYIIPFGSQDEDDEIYLSDEELKECGWVNYEEFLKMYSSEFTRDDSDDDKNAPTNNDSVCIESSSNEEVR